MTAAVAAGSRSRKVPLVAGLAGLLLLAGLGALSPRAALHGWLAGFAFVGGVPLGCLALLAIHRLTGGRWGEASRPVLRASAAVLPVLAVLVLPLILAARLLYPWAADPAAAGDGVAALYLNPLSVGLRSLVGLALLAALARLLLAGRLGPLGAGLALTAYAVLMDLWSYDWLLSLAPRFSSSAFGAQTIVAQILSALAVAVLFGRAPDDDPAWADIGGLMLAATLGESYLVLISFSIDWYGDLPDQAAWYLTRWSSGWRWLATAGALLGAALPLAALLFARVRRDAGLLRPVAASTLAGLLIQDLWLVVPTAGSESTAALLLGLLATAALSALLLGAAGPLSEVMGRRAGGD